MEDTTPHALTMREWREVMTVPEVREGWGLEDDETAEEFATRVYGVKFNFVSGGPGYIGDLYILQGDVVGDAPPMVLRRDASGSLMAP